MMTVQPLRPTFGSAQPAAASSKSAGRKAAAKRWLDRAACAAVGAGGASIYFLPKPSLVETIIMGLGAAVVGAFFAGKAWGTRKAKSPAQPQSQSQPQPQPQQPAPQPSAKAPSASSQVQPPPLPTSQKPAPSAEQETPVIILPSAGDSKSTPSA